MYYSRTGKSHGRFSPVKKITKLPKKTTENINFYWSLFDELDDNVFVSDCLNSECIDKLIQYKSNILHIDYKYELISHDDRTSLKSYLTTYNIPARQVKIYLQDDLQVRYFTNAMPKYSKCFQVFPRHYLTVDNKLYQPTQQIKTFSVFCRRHTADRLKFFFRLYKKGILDNSHWSYQCIDQNDSESNTAVKYGNKKFDCLLPKRLVDQDTASNQDHKAVYHSLASSLIHILIETVYDQRDYTGLDSYGYDKMPTDISEKTFKAVSQKKLFLVFATPYWLEDFQFLGFKSFSPYIDESYDQEEDNEKRMQLLVKEIQRLNNLNDKSLKNLVDDCQEAVEHNYRVWKTVVDQYSDLTESKKTI